VDVLINNAGVTTPERQSPLDMDFAGFAHALSVSSLAPLVVVQAVMPRLRASGAPKSLTISETTRRAMTRSLLTENRVSHKSGMIKGLAPEPWSSRKSRLDMVPLSLPERS